VAAVTLTGIDKRFGEAVALDGASLRLEPGRVHAIVGENGAGKSTLLRIAAGLLEPDRGVVSVLGGPLAPATAREAIRRGLAMVHQHFMLVPSLTALENLALGEATGFVLRLGPLRARAEELGRALGMELPLDARVASLSVGERQRLELLRVLLRKPRVLILDEPTAVLAPREAEALLTRVSRLAHDDGVAVAVVTHHLDEVTRFADEVTVLRRGKVVAHHAADDPAVHDVRALAREALGEEPPTVHREAEPQDRARLVLRGFTVEAPEGSGAALSALDLTVRAGEIVGIAGVEGNGQVPLELGLVGVLASHGACALDGAALRGDVFARRRAGLAWIPSDRHAHALPADIPAEDALVLGAMPTVRGAVDDAAVRARFVAAARALDVRPADPTLATQSFSGGNQQKLVVARELAKTPGLLVAAQPTRGVDLLVAARIRQRIVDAAADGAAVILISADLEELATVADRLLVLRRGRAIEVRSDAGRDVIGEAMLG